MELTRPLLGNSKSVEPTIKGETGIVNLEVIN